jgi:hypothetical protein
MIKLYPLTSFILNRSPSLALCRQAHRVHLFETATPSGRPPIPLVPKFNLGNALVFDTAYCARARHALSGRPSYTSAVSLAETKTAVDALSPDELTELAAFIRERDNAVWDRQIDRDFADGGRLSSIAEQVRADIRARSEIGSRSK